MFDWTITFHSKFHSSAIFRMKVDQLASTSFERIFLHFWCVCITISKTCMTKGSPLRVTWAYGRNGTVIKFTLLSPQKSRLWWIQQPSFIHSCLRIKAPGGCLLDICFLIHMWKIWLNTAPYVFIAGVLLGFTGELLTSEKGNRNYTTYDWFLLKHVMM